jgi:hypothetical protein
MVPAARRTGPEHRTVPDTHEPGSGLVGTWVKTTAAACADKYPATLAFSTGTYRGSRGPGQGLIWWDAGIYRLEDPQTLVVGTATDELISYPIVLRDDRFEVTDSEGCRVSYRRETRAP